MDHGAGEVDALKKGVRSCSRCRCLALCACLLHESWVGLVQESFYANAFGCRQANHRIGLERSAGKSDSAQGLRRLLAALEVALCFDLGLACSRQLQIDTCSNQRIKITIASHAPTRGSSRFLGASSGLSQDTVPATGIPSQAYKRMWTRKSQSNRAAFGRLCERDRSRPGSGFLNARE